MELILLSIAGTMTVLVAQFVDFVLPEHATKLVSRITAIPRRLTDSEMLTVTVPVATAAR